MAFSKLSHYLATASVFAAFTAASGSLANRAANPVEVPLTWSSSFGEYVVNISIGTPPQQFALVYDSGSSDVWVAGRHTDFCATGACSIFGAYNPNASTTAHETTMQFIEEYGTGGLVTGVFFQDTLEISGVKIPNFTFGYGTTVPAENVPILGMGLDSLQALATLLGEDHEVPSLLDSMVKAGVIESHAFGLYLDDEEAGKGSVTLGGIDTSKYQGDLVTYPMAKNASGMYDRYRLDLTSVIFTDDNGKNSTLLSNASVPVVLDSGATDLVIPGDLTTQLLKGLGGQYSPALQANVIECGVRNNKATVSFQLGDDGPMWTIPVSSLIDDQVVSQFEGGADACAFFVEPSTFSDNQSPLLGGYTLGSPFLRNFYVVYDQDNFEISIAQAKFNQTGKGTIDAIPSGSAGLSQAATTVSGTPTALSIPYSLTATAGVTASSGVEQSSAQAAATSVPATLNLSPVAPTFAVSTAGNGGASGASSTGSASSSSSSSSAAAKVLMPGMSVCASLLVALAGLVVGPSIL